MKNIVNMRMNSKLWKEFGETVDKLKILGYLKPNTNRSSLVRDFIRAFIESNRKGKGGEIKE